MGACWAGSRGCRHQRDRWSAQRSGFRDRVGRERDKCLRIRSDTPRFGCFGAQARQNRPVEAPWAAFGLKTKLELWVCKPLGVGGNVNQDSKWKSRLNSLPREGAGFSVVLPDSAPPNGFRHFPFFNNENSAGKSEGHDNQPASGCPELASLVVAGG